MTVPRVLYLTQHGLASPLGRAQCVPYLIRLSEQGRARFTVVSFESDPRPDRQLRDRVRAAGIRWLALPYHRGAVAKLWDVPMGLAAAFGMTARDRPHVVHARSHVMATIAMLLERVTGIPYVFDMLGMLADEYADSGHWRRGGALYLLTKRLERVLLRRAGAVISLTQANAVHLSRSGLVPTNVPLRVVPCAVDLERFRCDGASDDYPRGRNPRVVYSGGVGPWYMPEEMVAFFAAARRVTPDLRFLILTRGDTRTLDAAIRRHGLPPEVIETRGVHPDEVARLLCESDVGLSFRAPGPSKEAASPNKFGEYLACGLPVISSSGIGDIDDITARERIGVIVERGDLGAYEQAWRRAVDDLRADPAAMRARCRTVARRDLPPERVTEAYAELYSTLSGDPAGHGTSSGAVDPTAPR